MRLDTVMTTAELEPSINPSLTGLYKKPEAASSIPPTGETRVPTKRIPSLDGLRGISIWAVMLAHASSHFIQAPPSHFRRALYLLAPISYFGVTTFFVISGFLITSLLLKEHARTSSINLGAFYCRRAARILPAALFYISCVMLFAKITVSQALYAFTFTTTYFFDKAAKSLQQLWSLSVEEQFYFLWPLAFSAGLRAAKRFCWLIIFVSPIVRGFLSYHGYSEYPHFAPAIGDSVAAGCLLAFYEKQMRAFARRYFTFGLTFLLLCSITLCIAVAAYWWKILLLWGTVPCLISLVIATTIERNDAVLNEGVLAYTGLLSYSLYLWQQPFLVFDGPLNYFSARILMTFVLAYFSYQFIERPVVNFRTRARREKDLVLSVPPGSD